MQCVLEVLRGEAQSRAIPEAEWQAALALAEEQHVLPLLANKLLRNRSVPVPQAIGEKLRLAEREALLYGFLQSSGLKELLRAFSAAQIPVLPLKGPYLAERIYGSAALRISRDLDLLVRKPDFAAAALLLRTLDFAAPERADDYHQLFQRGDTKVELHFDVENPLAIDFDVTSAWQNALQGDFDGQPAWRLAPADEVLYLCLHGTRHRFERLSLVVDLRFALDAFGLRGASEISLRKQVRQERRLVLLGCALAKKLMSGEANRSQVPHGKGARRMDALADSLWSDLLTQPLSQGDWQSMHDFYLQTELSTPRRWYRKLLHLRILATRLIEADYVFARRFGMGRAWQVWLLRPLRLSLRMRARP